MKHSDVQTLLAHTTLPVAMVDVDAFERNIDKAVAIARAHGKTIRVATKSVRHIGLLRRIMDRGGDTIQGWLCFTAEEAVWLARQGLTDLLVAYPTVQSAPIEMVARAIADGHNIRLMVDSLAQMQSIEAQAKKVAVKIPVVVDVDVSYRPVAAVHVGVRRSPLREPAELEALLEAAGALPHVRICGWMAYEAQIAGIPDASPVRKAFNPLKKWLKARSVPDVAARRAQTAALFERCGVEVEVANGGGW